MTHTFNFYTPYPPLSRQPPLYPTTSAEDLGPGTMVTTLDANYALDKYPAAFEEV